uniref:Uncharacterized protein n=1 Tax=Fagus sylvatica TaxID=28930 RepID=A0A2N9FMG6_FAGSY
MRLSQNGLLKGKLKQAANQIVSGTKGYTDVSGHSLCYKVHDHEKIYIVESDMQVQQMRRIVNVKAVPESKPDNVRLENYENVMITVTRITWLSMTMEADNPSRTIVPMKSIMGMRIIARNTTGERKMMKAIMEGKLKQAANQIVSGTKGYTDVSGHSLCYKVHDHEKIYIVESDMQVQQMRGKRIVNVKAVPESKLDNVRLENYENVMITVTWIT